MLKLTRIGYWRSAREPQWPDPVEFVDDTWDPEERRFVVEYLKGGSRTPWLQMGFSTCRFCGQWNGTLDLTDGVYVWPEGLSHYLSDHGVRLPEAIVTHVRANKYAFDDEDVDEEWWKAARPDWK